MGLRDAVSASRKGFPLLCPCVAFARFRHVHSAFGVFGIPMNMQLAAALRRNLHFSEWFGVYITVWITPWIMCTTLKNEQIMKVTTPLWFFAVLKLFSQNNFPLAQNAPP